MITKLLFCPCNVLRWLRYELSRKCFSKKTSGNPGATVQTMGIYCCILYSDCQNCLFININLPIAGKYMPFN